MTPFRFFVPVALALLALPTVASAQDDVAAGLFTEAGKVPLAAQALAIDVVDDMATVVLQQTFANTADDRRQADFRLVLPRHAQVLGFGFFNGEEFLEAALKEKGAAEAAHRRAAQAGRSTGLMRHETVSHSFSVFPLRPHERKRVVVRLQLPVEVQGGIKSVTLPVGLFAGQSHSRGGSSANNVTAFAANNVTAFAANDVTAFAAPQTPIVAKVMANHAIASARLRGATTSTVVDKKEKTATLVGSTRGPVRLEWSESAAPLSVSATEVALPGGKRGVEIAVTFDDLVAAKSEHRQLAQANPPRRVQLLVDGSASMRGHRATLAKVMTRAFAQPLPLTVAAVADEQMVRLGDGTDADVDIAQLVAQATDGRAGHRLTRAAIEQARRALHCDDKDVRCVLVTDGQLEELAWATKQEWPTLVLADVDAVDREKVVLAKTSKANVFVEGASSPAALSALVDALLRPTLDVTLASYGNRVLKFDGRPKMRVAEGAQGRFVARLPRATRKHDQVIVDVMVAGKSVALKAAVERVKQSSVRGVALRKRVYRSHLDDLLRLYDRKPKERLRKDIIALSLRENIPTRLTAWHVEEDARDRAAPRLRVPKTKVTGKGGRRSGTKRGGAVYRKKSTYDFSDEDIKGELVKPMGGFLGATSTLGDVGGLGGLGTRGVGAGGGGADLDGDGGLSSGGGYGSGLGMGRGKARMPSVKGRAMPSVSGSMAKSVVGRNIRRNTTRIRYCYERALKSRPTLNGKLVVELVIAANGRVTSARAAEDTLKDAATVQCILKMLQRIRFPKPSGGGEVVVRYPFVFRSTVTDDDERKKK